MVLVVVDKDLDKGDNVDLDDVDKILDLVDKMVDIDHEVVDNFLAVNDRMLVLGKELVFEKLVEALVLLKTVAGRFVMSE